MKRKICAFLFLLVAYAVFNSSFSSPRPVRAEHPELSRAELHQAQLRSRFDNMRNQFTPGYRAELSVPGQVRGALGLSESDLNFVTKCEQGKIFRTSTKSNLAVDGNGWFVLEGNNETRFSRDGRFEFQEGCLRNTEGVRVLGYPLGDQGEIIGELKPILLTMEPETKCYAGKYADFRFDEAGILYGVSVLLDPVTGHRIETTTPLYQISLALFSNPQHLKRVGTTDFVSSSRSGEAQLNVAGTGHRGALMPSSLELSNVDYTEEGMAINDIKLAEKARQSSSLVLCGRLSSDLRERLEAEGVGVTTVGTLHTLDARDRSTMLAGLARVLEQSSEEESKLTKRLMLQLEPKLVFIP